MARSSRKSPFDVTLSADKRQEWTTKLVEEIRAAKQANVDVWDDGGLIDFAYHLYEQAPQKGISRDTPRYGGADLTSPIWTENVDSLSARATHTMFKQEPFWIVEGIGEESAQKSPVVEQYMQFRQEQIRLQKCAKRTVTAALVEFGSVFEVCEDVERCVKHEVVKADLMRNEIDNSFVLDAKGQPMPAIDPESGEPVPAPEDAEAHVEVKRTWTDYKRRGAYVRRRSMKDFTKLPSHAEDDTEVWGHAHRFWLTVAEIRRRVDDGEFDAEAAKLLDTDHQERDQRPENDRTNVQVVVPAGSDRAQKECWKVQLWGDIDGKGLSFYTAVVSEIHSCILSLKYDWLQRYRTVYVNPYPCPYSWRGYSMVLTKLLTTGEEHTAWRNMNADRGTLKANTPMKRKHGSQWDPSIQPFGMGIVIDVAEMNEVMPFEFDDVTPQAMNKEQQCVIDAQRLIGMNDIAIGQVSEKSRTLGENQMATQQSFVRTDDPISNIEEALEEVGELIHAIEVQALAEMEEGMQAPAAVTERVKYNGDPSFDGVFTKAMVDGQYRFKPRGSSEQANPEKRKQAMTDLTGHLVNFAAVNQHVAMRLSSPEFADAWIQMIVDEYKPRDRAAFLTRPAPPQIPGMVPGQSMEGQPMPEQGGGAPDFSGGILQQLTAGLPQGSVQ